MNASAEYWAIIKAIGRRVMTQTPNHAKLTLAFEPKVMVKAQNLAFWNFLTHLIIFEESTMTPKKEEHSLAQRSLMQQRRAPVVLGRFRTLPVIKNTRGI